MSVTEPDLRRMSMHSWIDFNDAQAATQSRYPQHDRDELRKQLLDQLESVLAYLFPHGKRRGSQFVVGNLNGDPGDSLVVELDGPKRGVWIDFATGESGDVFALWAGARGHTLPGEFAQVLDDVGRWFAIPTAPAAKTSVRRVRDDDLGAPTAKWDYYSTDGQLLACVYRYDTPTGKQYRPWDVKRRAVRMPEPRPLYNLPEVAHAPSILLVEGEKCADALSHIGFVSTTAMGGAGTALDKADWTPLAGKTVTIWPDHDDAGEKYAQAVIPKLQDLGVQVRLIRVPADKPKKWDAADAIAEGFDVGALIASASAVRTAIRPLDLSGWRAVDRFSGQPQMRRWLVEGVFPQAQAALVAAAGGVGKSFMLLALARSVAAHDGTWAHAPTLFGGALADHGVAVYVTAEDDAIEVHSRLNALGPIPDRLYVLPLPDAGGAVPLFAPDSATRAPAVTPAWTDLTDQLVAMPGLRLVVLDPLQPLCSLDLNVPENAQFVCSRLAALAAATGASVVVSHHFAKREASTAEQAREAIRGTGGLVDGVRSVYALWNPKEEQAKTVCKNLGETYDRGRVVMGGVVKANGRANLQVSTFLRNGHGLLVDRSQDIKADHKTDQALLPELAKAIARAAYAGQPYTKTGGNGLHERRHELPAVFSEFGKHRLVDAVDTLLKRGEVVLAMVSGSKQVKWLDVPNGPVARGESVFVVGHLSRSAAGRREGVQV